MSQLVEQVIIPVAASELISKVSKLKEDGYRMGQACCTKVSAGFEILYSFDKNHELLNLKLTIPEEEEIMSITGVYWSAFIYENEMQDLFGVKFQSMALNYGGHFFKVSQPTPWNPKN